MPNPAKNTTTDQQKLDGLETCMPEAETIIDSINILSIDLPYMQSAHHKLDLVTDTLRDLMTELHAEKQRLQSSINHCTA